MKKALLERHDQSTSLVEAKMREFGTQLDEFFKNSNQSPEILHALFEQHCLSSIHESIIFIYWNSLNKPKINRLLDRTIEYLQLNKEENLIKNPYYLKEIEFNEQIKNSALLHDAIMKNYENIFLLLLKSGFNSNNLLPDRKTPLSMCVVVNNIDPRKRLNYIQLLIEQGANAIVRDVNNVSPFQRLCGMESNYPVVYNFFRDYLLSVYPDEIESEFNSGLETALFNWCVPIVTDLLEHGATFDALKNVYSFEKFLSDLASIMFEIRRSISYIDPFILCFIQIILHNSPCENYSICIERFIQSIYIPGVCFEANSNPCEHPSMANVKNFLYLSVHFGYLSKTVSDRIRRQDLPKILTMPTENLLASQAQRQKLVDTLNQHFDELTVKYHKNPVSLKLFSIRKIRQSMMKVNQKNIEQLNISQYLKKMLYSEQKI
ncbi:unnamed protein product [Rotaria socialis]|uniref:Ankyrin repeat protein n=2 Tax=Rotaria socialis TaxID=392032 RepID=A0A818QM21_9BILA|nr:unnamed protein product [Rotaria socialis]